jgi:thymidine kinase
MLKYSKDTRYVSSDRNELVVSHDGNSYRAKSITTLSEFPDEELQRYKRVFIDEGQFFSDIMNFVDRARRLGVNVDISGLDLNHKRETFGQMGLLIDCADHKIKLQSVCSDCQQPASYTRMNSTLQSIRNEEIVIGGAELYSPVCEACHA